MCDTQTQAAIDQTISDLTSQNAMFTAFDVTKRVWVEMGNHPNDRWPAGFHSSIKGDIHSAMLPMLQVGTYQRTLQHIGAPTPAFVYHPQGVDPSQYQSSVVQQPQQTATIPAVSSNDGDQDDNGGKVHQLTQYGRLTVPNSLMKSVGFKPGDVAYISQTGGLRVLTSNDRGTILGSYVVDEDTNIRILKHALAAGGLDITKSFAFSVEGNDIVIENA